MKQKARQKQERRSRDGVNERGSRCVFGPRVSHFPSDLIQITEFAS